MMIKSASIKDEIKEMSSAVNEYIQTLRKLKKLPGGRSPYKRQQQRAKTRIKLSREVEANKLLCLIPNGPSTLNSIDLSVILRKSTHSPRKRFLIPETLISSENSLVFYYNYKEEVRSISGPEAIPSFFSRSRKKIKFSKHGHPSYFLKETDSVRLIYSEEEALSYIRGINKYTIFRYIHPSTNEIAKVRIHWKSNLSYKVYLITNKIRPKTAEKVERTLDNFKYQSIKWKDALDHDTSRSQDETPLINVVTMKSFQSIPTFTTMVKDIAPLVKLEQTNDDMYLLSDNRTSNWIVTKLSYIDKEPLQMIEHLAYIINNYNIVGSCIQEMVVDFCKDSHKRWYVLKIPQVRTVKPIRNTPMKKSLTCSVKEISLKRKIINNYSNSQTESMIQNLQIEKCHNEFSFVKKTRFNSVIREKKNKSLNLKIQDCMAEIENAQNSTQLNPKEFTSFENIEFYNNTRQIDRNGSFKGVFLSSSPEIQDMSMSLTGKDKLLHSTLAHRTLEKSSKFLMKQSLKKFNRIKTMNKRLKLPRSEIFIKYGGIKFVKNFVAELYLNLHRSPRFYSHLSTVKVEVVMKRITDFKRLFMMDLPFKDIVKLIEPFAKDKTQFKEFEKVFLQAGKRTGMSEIDVGILFSDLRRAAINCTEK